MSELLYKKPSKVDFLPQSNDRGSGTRKVSSRRQALQDFYKLKNEEAKAQSQASDPPSDPPKQTPQELADSLTDPGKLAEYLKTTPIEEILRLRNSITNKLNLHDSERKSIIYDNYYELIKLNQVLEGISKTNSEQTTLQKDTSMVSDEYVDAVFDDLLKFTERNREFAGDFKSVVDRFYGDVGDTDASSVRGVVDMDSEFPEAVNKSQLVRELSVVLGDVAVPPEKHSQYLQGVQRVLGSLDHDRDELVILELNRLKKRFS